jgi:hypothetical protein
MDIIGGAGEGGQHRQGQGAQKVSFHEEVPWLREKRLVAIGKCNTARLAKTGLLSCIYYSFIAWRMPDGEPEPEPEPERGWRKPSMMSLRLEDGRMGREARQAVGIGLLMLIVVIRLPGLLPSGSSKF